MEGVCKIYEEHLKRRNPNTPTITYDISQLFDFVDQVSNYYYIYNCIEMETLEKCDRSIERTGLPFVIISEQCRSQMNMLY